MTVEHWKRVKDLLHQAMQLAPADRPRFLDQECASDHALRGEVDSLLLAEENVRTTFMRSAPIDALPDGESSLIGPYKLVRQLGEGGMGTVYQAQQLTPIRRDVALKIIKPGMDSKQVILRFESERQALAVMDHANIARVFDAGTTAAGLPYFVMELVDGVPITQYCDTRRLGLRERIELFIPVCRAIQHAHQKGIIHRDIKSSNILVSEQEGKAIPKVIDFGLAKALGHQMSDATQMTNLGMVLGTLNYMSPEQAALNRQDIDTRSDVYSLGAVLYELLTGTTPLERERLANAGYVEALQFIRQEEAPSPSARMRRSTSSADLAVQRQSNPPRLCKLLSGELDWITMKALEKDRTRRYETANGLARDLERYLAREPVEAAPPSAAYRFGKFVRRHRKLLAAAAAFAAVLLAAVAVSSWMAVRASRAEQETRAVNDFLQRDVLAQASPYGQTTLGARLDPDIKVRTALDRAAARIDQRFRGQPLVEASLRQTIGDTYAHLGLYPAAARQVERALELRTRWLGPYHYETLVSMHNLVADYMGQGKYAQAEQLATKVLEARRRVLGEQDPETILSMSNLAGLYLEQGKLSQAEQLNAKALPAATRAWGDQHPNTLRIMDSLARVYKHEGRFDLAESLYTRALEARRRVSGPEHPETLQVMNDLGTLYEDQGKFAQAEPLQTAALEIRRRVLGPEHPRTLQSMNNVAGIYVAQGKYAEAERIYTSALESRRRISGPNHTSTLIVMGNLAQLYSHQGRFAQAEALFAETLETQRRSLGEQNDHRLATMNDFAGMYLEAGKYSQAEATYAKVLELRRRVLGDQHPSTVDSLAGLGHARLLLHQYAEADQPLRTALIAYEQLRPDTWERFASASMLGASLAGQKKFAEAEPLLVGGYEGLNRRQAVIPAPDRSSLQEAQQRIVDLYKDWTKPDKAAEWRAKFKAAAVQSAARQ